MACMTAARRAPPSRSRPATQPPNAPCPGTTTLSARATRSASDVTTTSAPTSASAFSTLRRLPLPVSATATMAFAVLTRARSPREGALRRRHADDARIGAHGHRGRARERLEQRLDHVVRVLAVAHLEVQVDERRRREAAEELARELGVERPDCLALDLVRQIDECSPPRKIDGRLHERLVHGDDGVPVARDA